MNDVKTRAAWAGRRLVAAVPVAFNATAASSGIACKPFGTAPFPFDPPGRGAHATVSRLP